MTLEQQCNLIERIALTNSEPKPIYQKTVPKDTAISGNIRNIIPCGDYNIVQYTK